MTRLEKYQWIPLLGICFTIAEMFGFTANNGILSKWDNTVSLTLNALVQSSFTFALIMYLKYA